MAWQFKCRCDPTLPYASAGARKQLRENKSGWPTPRKSVKNLKTYPLVNIVCAELHSGVGHNSYTIGTISGHEASPALLSPHFCQCLVYRHFVLISSYALYLKQDLQTFERRYDGSGNGAGDSASNEGSNNRLCEDFLETLERCSIWGSKMLYRLSVSRVHMMYTAAHTLPLLSGPAAIAPMVCDSASSELFDIVYAFVTKAG